MTGHNIRTRILERLREGPATEEQLCEAGWGAEWDWPERVMENLRVHLSVLRRELAGGGREVCRANVYQIAGRRIDRHSVYKLTEGH